MILKATIIAFHLVIPAQLWSGNELVQVCRKDPNGMTPRLYVMGVYDALARDANSDLKPMACIPPDTTASAMTEIVCNYIQAHPENRTLNAAQLTEMALNETYPGSCKAGRGHD